MRYLLGEMSDAERQTLEERFFQDDSFFEEMLALEDELFYEYQQNCLSPSERIAFERKFLNTREDRNKMAFAEAFLQTTAELAEEKAATPGKIVEDSPASWWQSIAAFFNFSSPAMQFGFAAASILLLLGVIGLFIQNARRQDEMAKLENSRPEERRQQEQIIAEKEQQQAELERQLESEKLQSGQNEKQIRETDEAQRLQLEQEIAEARRRVNQPPQKNVPQSPKSQTQPPPQQRSVVALILSPGLLTRSGGEGMNRVLLSPSVKNLQLRLLLKNADDYKSYRATLKTIEDGTQVWAKADLKPQRKGKNKSLSLSIPAKNLQRADYEISLVGITASGETEEITNYYFSVVKGGVRKH